MIPPIPIADNIGYMLEAGELFSVEFVFNIPTDALLRVFVNPLGRLFGDEAVWKVHIHDRGEFRLLSIDGVRRLLAEAVEERLPIWFWFEDSDDDNLYFACPVIGDGEDDDDG